MKIERNTKREALLIGQIKDSFTKEGPRTGVHLSDLLSPRKSFFGRIAPIDPTNGDVLYWLAGRGHEDAFGRIAGLTITEQKFWYPKGDVVCVVEVGGHDETPISFRPDFTFNKMFPGEMKTRRWNLADPGEEAITYESYLEQLRGYCAIEEVNYGLLIVLSLLEGKNRNDPMSKSEPVLAAYDVFFSDEELAATREWLTERRDAFTDALTSQDHTSLPLCKDWMCGKPKKVVDQKPYCLTCDKEFSSQAWIAKHRASKSGDGHDTQDEVARWEYEPRCKYYDMCRPQDVDPQRGAREGDA